MKHLLWILPGLLCAVAHGGGVYWSDRGASQLKRMDFQGGSLAVIPLSGAVTTPGTNIRGIAVDTVNERIYWADNGADRVLRCATNGSGSVILHTTVGGGSSFPADVRLDLQHGHLYWCDRDRNVINRAALDGSNVMALIPSAAPSPTGPYFMDLDLEGSKIYWGDAEATSIFRANMDGTGKETLLTGNNKTRAVCLDREGGMLYWVNRDDKKIHRCPVSAFTNGTITLTHPAVQTLYSGLDTPHGMVLDIPARKIYWADTGGNTGVGSGDKAVSRGDMDGLTPMEVLATGSEPWDVDLDRRCASYSEWRLRCFRRDASPSQTDSEADPDGDAVNNAAEYAFNLPPTYSNIGAPVLPTGLIVTNENVVYHGLRYRCRTGTSDLAVYVQSSTNLVTWTGTASESPAVEIQRRDLGDGIEERLVRTPFPITDRSSHFWRVRIQLNP